MPKVSVIIPNYNHAAYLNKRIQSVLNQTFQDFELILLDDCSTDNSLEILRQYNNHPKVGQFIVNQTNSGSTFKQWQKGIKEATGEYIWIAESDDFADHMMLETLVKQLDSYPTAGIAYCQSWVVDENDTIIRSCKEMYPSIGCNSIFHGKELLAKYMAGSNLIPNASAVVFKREITLQFDNNYTQFKFSGDWWFWCELLMQGDLIHVCEQLNYFRFHQQKVTISSTKQGLYFTEGLHILSLLRQKGCISQQTYVNKSKNWANTFFHLAMKYEADKLSWKIRIKVLTHAYKSNPLFVWRVLYLFIKQKLNF